MTTTARARCEWSGVGSIVAVRRMPILLHALAAMGRPVPVEVTVLGSGPETSAWQALARRLHVDGGIRWAGQLARDDALQQVSCSDVLVVTSIQDGTSHVVVEALSLGVPVICHDACGMGVAVTTDCGIKCPLKSPRYSIRGFAEAIRRLQADPAELQRLSAGAMRRADELSWDAKAAIIADAVDHIVSTKSGNDDSSHD